MEKLIFGTFKVNNIEFAIEAKHIQEVVQSPGKFQEIPLSDPCLLGLFNLRDLTIPVVSIRKIFQFQESENPKEERIVLLRYEEMLVGVLVDSTEEILSGVDDLVANFLSRDNGPSVVKGVIQLSDQNRMVQIIDPLEVVNFQTMPHMKQKLKILNQRRNHTERKQCISFRVGDLVTGLDIECIQEIIEAKPIDTTALSGTICLGAFTLRGTSIPVLNTKALFEMDFDLEQVIEQAQHQKIVIMRLDGFHFGLLVDTVENIITYFEEDLRVFPVVSKSSKQMIKGCIIKENIDNTVLLDFEKLINSSEISEITKGHASLYKVESTLQRRKSGPTVTYLAFTLDDPYAAILKDVKEVLSLPENLMQPPGMHEEMLGVLNLRGTMVPIIDPRKRYSIELAVNEEGLKIVVFPSKGGDVGLVVSSIDSILHINNINANIFDSITKEKGSKISEDVISGFEMVEEKTSLLVLDLQRIGLGYFEEPNKTEEPAKAHDRKVA